MLSSSVPRQVGGKISSKTVVTSCCGSDHTAAVTLEGEVYTFGMARGGRLGLPQAQAHIVASDMEIWVNCFEPARVNAVQNVERVGKEEAMCSPASAGSSQARQHSSRHDSSPDREVRRVGRCRDLPVGGRCALAMGAHDALGANSGLQVLPGEMLESIAEAAGSWPLDWKPGAVCAGLVRLMGGRVSGAAVTL